MNPIIINNLYNTSISKLRKLKFFIPGECKSAPITFKSINAGSGRVDELGTIGIMVSLQASNEFIEFDYECNGVNYRYQVKLVSVKSNLGKGGHLWYFLCPETGARCSKLYFHDNEFVSRKSIPNAFYRGEVKSKKWRINDKNYNQFDRLSKIILQGRLPTFKRTYKGQFTKRYNILLQAVATKQALTQKIINESFIEDSR